MVCNREQSKDRIGRDPGVKPKLPVLCQGRDRVASLKPREARASVVRVGLGARNREHI
jgi:hypothetical protein